MSRRPFRIGDRVRLRGSFALGTVFANPYEFGGVMKVAVIWDAVPGVALSEVASALEWTGETLVPPDARPYSFGALAAPERRFA